MQGAILRKLNTELWHFFEKKEKTLKLSPFFSKSAKVRYLTFLKSPPALVSSTKAMRDLFLMKLNAASGPRELGKSDPSEI